MDRKQRDRLKERKRKQAKDAARAAKRNAISTLRSGGMTVNRRFNRQESTFDNYYFDNYGWASSGHTRTSGRLKCRLLHGNGYSLVVPDQIFVGDGWKTWIQPLAFGPSVIYKIDAATIIGHLTVDISCGNVLQINFSHGDLIRAYPDGSQLFACEIDGPVEIESYGTGDARWEDDDEPFIRLFHHTTPDARAAIETAAHFRTSPWNIQGSAKKLKNVGYTYFTSLDALTRSGDLRRVAMDEAGVILLRRDGFDLPPVMFDNWRETYVNDILELPVYASDPAKRAARLDVWVSAALLAPQHIYRHDEGRGIYFEFPHAFIHRVGADPGGLIQLGPAGEIRSQPGLRTFDYVVVGDCSNVNGLAAPYDEEDTTHILKLERLPAERTVHEFWFENANSDLFSGKVVELQEFTK
jgi:hypothetical protein